MGKENIKVEIKEVDKKLLRLTQHFGNGTLGDTKFDARFTLPNFNLLVKVDDKEYEVSNQDIISAVIDKHLEKKSECPHTYCDDDAKCIACGQQQ